MKSDLMNHIEYEHVEKESIKESSEFEILDHFSEHKATLEKKNATSVHDDLFISTCGKGDKNTHQISA